MCRKIIDDYRLEYLNDWFGIKLIFLRSELYVATFCICIDVTWIVDYTQKRESGFCLENATMFQIQDMFENVKPNIVLKTVKRFNINNLPIIILI